MLTTAGVTFATSPATSGAPDETAPAIGAEVTCTEQGLGSAQELAEGVTSRFAAE
jgi:hypothetical protein